MKQDSKRLTSIIIALLLIVVALVVYFEMIVPAYANLESVKGQEESEQTLFANEKQIVSQVQSLLASYESNSSSSQEVQLALPVGQDVAGALAQVYGIGANSNVTVDDSSISAQAVQAPASGASAGQLTSVAASGAVVAPVGTVSIQVSGTGTYEAIQAFLQGLQTNIRLFDVTSMSLQPAGAGSGAPSEDLFNYSVTVVTYYQSPQ